MPVLNNTLSFSSLPFMTLSLILITVPCFFVFDSRCREKSSGMYQCGMMMMMVEFHKRLRAAWEMVAGGSCKAGMVLVGKQTHEAETGENAAQA